MTTPGSGNVHRTVQDWGLWTRSSDSSPQPQHYHKAKYLSSDSLVQCYSDLDLGPEYRQMYRGNRSRNVSSSSLSRKTAKNKANIRHSSYAGFDFNDNQIDQYFEELYRQSAEEAIVSASEDNDVSSTNYARVARGHQQSFVISQDGEISRHTVQYIERASPSKPRIKELSSVGSSNSLENSLESSDPDDCFIIAEGPDSNLSPEMTSQTKYEQDTRQFTQAGLSTIIEEIEKIKQFLVQSREAPDVSNPESRQKSQTGGVFWADVAVVDDGKTDFNKNVVTNSTPMNVRRKSWLMDNLGQRSLLAEKSCSDPSSQDNIAISATPC